MTKTEVLAKHYMIAALWADAEEGTSPRISQQMRDFAIRRAWEFVEMLGATGLAEQIEKAHANGYGAHPDCGNEHPVYAAAGHDLWLTSQGHGGGFWDRNELPKELGQKLTELARRFSGVHLEQHHGRAYLRGAAPLSLGS